MTPVWPRKKQPARSVEADRGGVGAGRDVSHNALGPGSQVFDNRRYYVQTAPQDVTWPLQVGAVPGLASAFQPRTGLREQIDAARAEGSAAVLTQVLSGGGGVGKSQLAASYADAALREGTDLVLWATANEAQQVITLYAQAAGLVGAPGASGENPQDDARAFVSWLATTDRRWLVVLDDVTDPAGMASWWPESRTGKGWVLATTRLHDARLSGGGRRTIDVDVYSPAEADAYLRSRLADTDHLIDATVADLAAALGHLPLALSHAAAYMINEDLTCARYLARFRDNSRRLDQVLPESADTEGYGRQVATTLLLSLDAAQRTEPKGLALPALRLAALLDPAGHPKAVWEAPATLGHLTQHGEAGPVTAEQAHTTLRTLHRYALITHDTRQEPQAVSIHALTARAIRERMSTEDLPTVTATAAEALRDIWPEPDQPHPDLAATLRANTDALADHTGDLLWHGDGHLLLFRAGRSLYNTGLPAAIDYWQHLAAESERTRGPEYLGTLTAQANLATAYQQAGHTNEAIALGEQALTALEHTFGPDHPNTLAAQASLATSYQQAGRIDEAIPLQEQNLAELRRTLGPDHPDPLTAQANLATSYAKAGRTDEAISLGEQVLTERERVLGPHHPSTLLTKANLASTYGQAGRVDEALTLEEQVLTEHRRILGPHHPSTLRAQANLATSYAMAGRTDEAIPLQEQALTEHQRTLGLSHPSTLRTQANLAAAYRQVGRIGEAITLEEQVLTEHRRIFGPDHPDTLLAQTSLAASYGRAGRANEGITLNEQVLTGYRRIFGPDHPDTLAAQGSLAASYGQAGRIAEAIPLMEQAFADHERVLGPNDPSTQIINEVLVVLKRHQKGS